MKAEKNAKNDQKLKGIHVRWFNGEMIFKENKMPHEIKRIDQLKFNFESDNFGAFGLEFLQKPT